MKIESMVELKNSEAISCTAVSSSKEIPVLFLE